MATIIQGFSGGVLQSVHLANTKAAAREIALRWSHCDAFRFGRKFYTPSQVYAGMLHSTPPLELGLNTNS